jgi:DNA adenine methylase
MSLKPILKYPGSKTTIASWITSYFPEHIHYLEPYCGSAAVFFNKTPAVHEVLNDINGSLTHLFRVIREHGEDLAAAIEMTPWSEEEYHFCGKQYLEPSGDDIEDARRFLVKSWQTHGSKFDVTAGWKHNGLHASVYPTRLWRKLPSRISAAADRLKDAEIRNRPALEMIAYYNDPDCLIYADPPYIHQTRTGGRLYRYEMTDDEHVALLNALDVHRGPVVLSGYSHPVYDNRLTHWQRVTTPAVTEHGNIREEVLWLNPRAAGSIQMPLFGESEAVS